MIQQLRADGVTSVIPLVPFNVFFPVLRPRHSSSTSPSSFSRTTRSRSNRRSVCFRCRTRRRSTARKASPRRRSGASTTGGRRHGGYDPGVRSCFTAWHKAYPEIPKGNQNFYIEEQGPVQGWCQEIRLFAPAARAAGPASRPSDLRRGDGQDLRLPRWVLPHPHLRSGQVLGPDPVPDGPAAHQLPPSSQCKFPLEPDTPRGVLGGGEGLAATAGRPVTSGPVGTGAPWWQTAVLYQVYPRSFADSNGDGRRGPEGVIDRLDHLEWLGIDGIWLSPITVSPNADWGYDVADYRAVKPDLGTWRPSTAWWPRPGRRGIRVVLDIVPNHTSDQHPWFVDSRSSRRLRSETGTSGRTRGADGSAPNNWVSSFGGPAWTLDAVTGQYYLHNHLAEQPDLNWWNEEVRDRIRRDPPFLARPRRGRLPDRRVQHHRQGRRALRDNPPATALTTTSRPSSSDSVPSTTGTDPRSTTSCDGGGGWPTPTSRPGSSSGRRR